MGAYGNTTGNDEEDFKRMAMAVPEDQPRWILLNLNDKLIFINYIPDACTKIPVKFAYANNKAKVKSEITVQREIPIYDKCDLTINEIRADIR